MTELGRLISSQVQPNISASQKKNVRLIIVGMMNQWDGDDIDSSSKSPSLNERSNKRTNERTECAATSLSVKWMEWRLVNKS